MVHSDLSVIHVEALLPHMSPVDYVHIIISSKYLYKKYRDKILEKRKESLVGFMECRKEPDKHNPARTMSRGYKLPNGRLEGVYKELTIADEDLTQVGGNKGGFSYYEKTYINGVLRTSYWYTMNRDSAIAVWKKIKNGSHINIDKYAKLILTHVTR